MTGRRRNNLVESRADLILGDELAAEEYAVHFEAQMHRGEVRKVLYISYLARAGAFLVRLCYLGFGDPAPPPAALPRHPMMLSLLATGAYRSQ
jgi:hypothetical protein